MASLPKLLLSADPAFRSDLHHLWLVWAPTEPGHYLFGIAVFQRAQGAHLVLADGVYGCQ